MTGGSTLSPTEVARVRRIGIVARVVAAVVIGLGALVLVGGWWLDLALLRTVASGLAPMKANTALALMLAGASLLLELDERLDRKRLARALGGGVFLIGAATLLEHAGLELGIDQLLVAVHDGAPHPGRISIATSSALVFLGLAQAAGAGVPSRARLLTPLARVSAAIALIAVIGYLYRIESLYSFRPFETIAVHTAASILALSVMLLRVRGGAIVNVYVADGAGGELVRRLLPAATLVPTVLGWFCLTGLRAGYYDAPLALALLAASNAGTFLVLMFFNADRLQAAYSALRVQEEDLRITLHSIGDGVIATDERGRVTRMNPVAEALTGWRLDEARGKPIDEVFRIVHEETREKVESPVDRVLREGIVVGLANHTALIARDASECAIADSGAPIRDDQGVLRGVVLVFRDQSEERRAQEARDRFVRLAESGLFGVLVGDASGPIEEANDEFLRIIGMSRERFEKDGLRWQDLVPDDGEARAEAATRSVRERGVTPATETVYRRTDGTHVPVLRGAAALDGGRFIAFILDRSAQARAELGRREAEEALRDKEELLRQSQKMEAIGQLAGGVAHDFNNLLSVILSYASMMKADLPPGDPSLEAAEEIEQAGLRASQLTKQLLAFGRRQLLQPKALDLNETLEKMGSLLRRLIGEDVELVLRTSSVPSVLVDPGQMEQVIMNLAVNARDAMPRGGRITIATRETTLGDENDLGMPAGTFVELTVSDTGGGIESRFLPHIFEPFFTTKAIGKGTGLGLATVFGIVSQSGGHVRVASELERGTTFRVLLPRAEAARPASTTTPSKPSLRPVGNETILLVEDDAQLRTLGIRVLERAGYRVLAAEDGEAGLLAAKRHEGPIHLLLTDVVMPRMSGRLLADEIVRSRPSIKVLFMSGYTDDKVLEHGIASDALSLLQKPVAPARLLSEIRKKLDG